MTTNEARKYALNYFAAYAKLLSKVGSNIIIIGSLRISKDLATEPNSST